MDIKQRNIWVTIAGVLIIGAIAGAGWFWQKSQNLVVKTPSPNKAIASGFGVYVEPSVNFKPQVPAFSTDNNLSNLENRDLFLTTDFSNSRILSDGAKNLLAKNLFAVVPTWRSDEFFQIYEANRYSYIPNFVTTDSILHNYHLVFDYLLKNLEQQKLSEVLKNLTADMLKESTNQYSQAKGTQWENAAKRNVGFFTVADHLLGGNSPVPEYISTEVNQELAFISAHQGIEVSPLINMGQDQGPTEALKEDYSQYIPRGHYTKSQDLQNYFKTMMWYGRLTFRFKSDDEIKSAALMTKALTQAQNSQNWEKIYGPTAFFVGSSDDITYLQLGKEIEGLYGTDEVKTMAGNTEKFNQLKDSLAKLEAPKLNSIPIFEETINPDREKEIKGFRFMGQRFTIDAQIFQNLIYRDVKENPQGEKRYLPKALDIPAALGSAEALSILQSQGQTEFSGYIDNLKKLQQHLTALSTGAWTQNLYWGWIYSLRPLVNVPGAGYPSFMLNQAWQRKALNTFAGSWTELKHDTILYAKQVYAEMGGGGESRKLDDRGYVEPEPYVYARLAGLLKMTREGLQARELLTQVSADNLSKMEELSVQLKNISEKELNNQALTDQEYDLIRSYGGQLEHFWLEANKEEMESSGMDKGNYLNQNPAAIVADVATDPNGSVLEEGTGPLQEILVVVPIDGKLRLASGVIWSQYEFKWPLNDRLTDEKWRELINGESENKPTQQDWQKSFQAQ
ncbi:MAG: DUF3160 domain-containing protein [Candidatus Doudnabacteria bacterium]